MQYLDTEEDITHGDDENQEIKYEEMLVAAGVMEKTTEEMEADRVKAAIAVVMILCSCGSAKCGAIRYFGLPKPKFHEHIEPIGSQLVRDSTARRMKTEDELSDAEVH